MAYERDLLDRFWGKVDKESPDKCWNWLASTLNSGYGSFQINGKTVLAHRVSWELTNGPIPKNMMCLHKCDNKLCCNPDHIYLGSSKDNARDRSERTLISPEIFGSGSTKLSKVDIEKIRLIKNNTNRSQKSIAKEFNVCQMTISNVLRSKLYLCKEGYYV